MTSSSSTSVNHNHHTTQTAEPRHLAQRYLWFILGVAINSFGVAFITKASLGTSPISSVPYVLDLATPLTFGQTTFVLNLLFIAAQVFLLRHDFKPVQFLQIAVNLIFSSIIDLSMSALYWFTPAGIIAQLCSLLLGCAILAFGIAIEVAPNALFVPGEGIVRAISAVTNKPFGTCKVIFDVTLACTALVLSFIFFGHINGLGLGTIVSALIVGRICNFYNLHIPLLSHIAHLARRADGSSEEAI